MRAEVIKTVVKSRLMSKMLPIPKAIDLDKKISICHFMIRAPKVNPIRNRVMEKGKNLTIRVYSFSLKAGFKKDKVWAINRGRATIRPVAIPQLMARLMN